MPATFINICLNGMSIFEYSVRVAYGLFLLGYVVSALFNVTNLFVV